MHISENLAEIQAIAHHPEVVVDTHPDGAPLADLAPYMKRPHLALVGEGGCFLLANLGPGHYEVHTNFVPEARGRNALTEGARGIAFMFTATDCVEILTKVPVCNRRALLYARMQGFHHRFTRRGVWLKGGVAHDMDYLSLRIDEWVLEGHDRKRGQAFHEKLHAHHPGHADDPVHDAYVGAAITLVAAGSHDKGIALYNRWAAFAGYLPVRKISDSPLRIDIRDCVLRVENGDFTIEEH